jgi:DNA-binding beta-propeller fold protein YncE
MSTMPPGRKISGYCAILLLMAAAPLRAQTTFTLKSAPPDLNVYFNGELIQPVSAAGALRNYRINGAGMVQFGADGYLPLEYHSVLLPAINGRVEIKLENEDGLLTRIGEYAAGIQPKSAYWTPDGQRLFVPLLGQHGIDVFRLTADETLAYEKRLLVPDSKAPGFVEALCDAKRRELWVSNMTDNKVHIFDLDTLEYKTSLACGGEYPKVIVQSPDGGITVVSNWVSRNLSVFDSETKKLLRRVSVGGTPRGMAFSPDGGLLYTAIYDAALVEVVNMTQHKVTSRFRFHEGEGAARHVIYRDKKLYVSDMYRGTVNILNASTGALLASKRVGPNINTIVMSPDGRYIFASSRGRNNPADYTKPGPDFGAIYMLDAADLTVQERIWGRNQPTGLAVSPDGKFLAFTDFLDANLELYRLP